jgi:hypothetical protein
LKRSYLCEFRKEGKAEQRGIGREDSAVQLSVYNKNIKG